MGFYNTITCFKVPDVQRRSPETGQVPQQTFMEMKHAMLLFMTATLEHINLASLDKFKNNFSPWICKLRDNDT